MSFFTERFSSPIGDLIVRADEHHLLGLAFADSIDTTDVHSQPIQTTGSPVLRNTKKQLEEYFAGIRHTFDIPIDPQGTTFQKNAWKALQAIPYGTTRSYQEEAQMANHPKAVRAIGGANNKNPIVIIIPCHRVIGKNGTLTGYAG